MRQCKSSSKIRRAMAKVGLTCASVALLATAFSPLTNGAASIPAPGSSPAQLSHATSASYTPATAMSDMLKDADNSQPVPQPPLPPAAATPAKQTAPPAPVQAVPQPATPSTAELTKLKPKDGGQAMGRAGKSAPGSTVQATPRQAIPSAWRESSPASSTGLSVQLASSVKALPAAVPMAIQPDGTGGLPLGMDVSGWQQNVDWQTAWNNGARFAYIKASEGPWALNDYFAQQYNGSAAVGMIRGAYAFARPDLSSGANQATVLVQSGGGWSADGLTLPGVLDLEANSSDQTGTCFGMTPAQLTSWTADFTRTYKSLTGRDAVIYTAYYFWQSCLAGTSAFSQSNPLWIAAYGAPANDVWMPGNWPQFTFWQYADTGTFPGDQNIFNGSYSQLKTLALAESWKLPPKSGVCFIDLFKFLCKSFIQPYIAIMQIIELLCNIFDQGCCHNFLVISL